MLFGGKGYMVLVSLQQRCSVLGLSGAKVSPRELIGGVTKTEAGWSETRCPVVTPGPLLSGSLGTPLVFTLPRTRYWKGFTRAHLFHFSICNQWLGGKLQCQCLNISVLHFPVCAEDSGSDAMILNRFIAPYQFPFANTGQRFAQSRNVKHHWYFLLRLTDEVGREPNSA